MNPQARAQQWSFDLMATGVDEQTFFALWRERFNRLRIHREDMAARRKADPAAARSVNQRWYYKNVLRARAMAKSYRSARDADPIRLARHRAWCLENIQKKLETDLQFRIKTRLRGRIWMAVHKIYGEKTSTIDLVGCTMEEFRRHIESLWLPGMSWENYGRRGWHIDHRKACARFDLTDPEQQRACFHFSNTQPLWAWDNLSKGAR
jgi:hypothetical protein